MRVSVSDAEAMAKDEEQKNEGRSDEARHTAIEIEPRLPTKFSSRQHLLIVNLDLSLESAIDDT